VLILPQGIRPWARALICPLAMPLNLLLLRLGRSYHQIFSAVILRHLQFAEGTKPHLCIVERNSPTPVRRRISLTQESLGRVIPGGEGPGDGINVWRREDFMTLNNIGFKIDLSYSIHFQHQITYQLIVSLFFLTCMCSHMSFEMRAFCVRFSTAHVFTCVQCCFAPCPVSPAGCLLSLFSLLG